MKSKKIWSWIGLFMIVLIVMLPVYSADVLAVSVQITKNQGEAGIEGFIDGEGDTWTVEAKVSGAEPGAVSAEKVTLKILPDGFPVAFNLCQSSTLETVCTYQNQLSGISAGIFNFEVGYSYFDAEGYSRTAPAFGTISSDRFAPQISRPEISTNAENIKFSVDDSLSPARRHTPSSGLQKVEIVDDDNERVLKTFTTFTDNKKFEYDGPLEVTLSGEGNRYFKIRAGDNLGHSEESETVELATDFVAPVIGAVELKGLEEGFIGENSITTDLVVEVTETNDVMVTAASEQIDIYDEEGVCLPDEEEIDLWHCEWQEVVVLPLEQVSVTITAEDEFGNVNTNTYQFPKFTKDETPPEIVEFGTPHSYEGEYYIKSGEQKIILKVTDVGSWFDEEEPGNNILANLRALGVSSNRKAPDAWQLAEDGSSFDCYWETRGTGAHGDTKTISLVKFEDEVGNQGGLESIDLIVDKVDPIVEKVEVYGFDLGGKKDYFQSNDQLLIKLRVKEDTGVIIKVDLNDAINDADQAYPATVDNEEGWAVFTSEEYCEPDGTEYWDCEFLTDEIRSGYDSAVQLKIEVADTAGNLAKQWPTEARNVEVIDFGKFTFELLALDEETEPEFWEVDNNKIKFSPPFIDLGITNLIPPRISVTVPLTSEQEVIAKRIDASGCVLAEDWEGPQLEVARASIYGTVTNSVGEVEPTLVLELFPFGGPEEFADIIAAQQQETGRFVQSKVPLVCSLLIFSATDNKIMKFAETQSVRVEVPFAFTALGGQEVNIESKIKEARESALTSVAGFVSSLKKILSWVSWGCKILSTINTIIELIGGASIALDTNPATSSSGKTLCAGIQEFKSSGWGTLYKTLNWLCRITSCSGWGEIFGDDSDTESIESWQPGLWKEMEKQYGKTPLSLSQFGQGGFSADDSLILSIASLCPSGIIYNLDKFAQVQCRYIYCLENDIPAGLANLEFCEKLRSYQLCTTVIGDIFYSIPWTRAVLDTARKLIDFLKSGAVGLYSSLVTLACGKFCATQASIGVGCGIAHTLNAILTLIDDIAYITQAPKSLKADYCSQIGITWFSDKDEEESAGEESQGEPVPGEGWTG